MTSPIKIQKKNARRGDDEHRVISVRLREPLVAQLDALALQTNRSRNELIGLLLEVSLPTVLVLDDDEIR